ncbi:DNA-directed DNA polymerase eta rad30, partial [Ascosphaera acerosa]
MTDSGDGDRGSDAPHDSYLSSRFTYRQLQLLRGFSTKTPLRVIAHIDLDAFYAQCEMVRLGMPRDVPLAVQQWNSLVAINYAARPFNVTRMISADEARKRCPGLVCQHVATFREGEGGRWAYRPDAAQRSNTDKVSLDPYRIESRKIMSIMREALVRWAEDLDHRDLTTKSPGGGGWEQYSDMVRFEKASVDETFIDLSRLVHATLLERYPFLRATDGARDPQEKLPRPPQTSLRWGADTCVVDLDQEEQEQDNPDWDDIGIAIGAEIVKTLRQAVWQRLQYTCSGGVGRNKMIAKLGSARNKPDKQTVIRNRAVQSFMNGYKFTKIRMLGGKLGKQIAETFDTEEVSDLYRVPIAQMRAKLGDETANWLYLIVRGEDHSEVSTRVQIKSMLSAKVFRPKIHSVEQIKRWLHIFAADIYNRLVQDGILEHKRRPRVISLHCQNEERTNGSRQMQIPQGVAITEELLLQLANQLLEQTVATIKTALPCAHLSLAVSGFEEGTAGTKSLRGFFEAGTRPNGDAAVCVNTPTPAPIDQRLASKRKHEDHPEDDASSERFRAAHSGVDVDSPMNADQLSDLGFTICTRCRKPVPETETVEHSDRHLAEDMINEERR